MIVFLLRGLSMGFEIEGDQFSELLYCFVLVFPRYWSFLVGQ